MTPMTRSIHGSARHPSGSRPHRPARRSRHQSESIRCAQFPQNAIFARARRRSKKRAGDGFGEAQRLVRVAWPWGGPGTPPPRFQRQLCRCLRRAPWAGRAAPSRARSAGITASESDPTVRHHPTRTTWPLWGSSLRAPSVAGDLPPPHRRTGFLQPPATLLPPDRAQQACDPAARPARRSAAPRQ
eukprot:COSAG06_NODE_4575_length_4131_cov_3.121280_4_plen_185_part_01